MLLFHLHLIKLQLVGRANHLAQNKDKAGCTAMTMKGSKEEIRTSGTVSTAMPGRVTHAYSCSRNVARTVQHVQSICPMGAFGTAASTQSGS